MPVLGQTLLRRLRSRCLAVALLTSVSGAALAVEVAVPAKAPTVTLNLPERWTQKDIDNGIQLLSPDEAVVLYVNYSDRAEVETTLKNYREWMKKQKIVVNTPKESSMDFAGTPGRVIRYDTKMKTGGKTIVDFIVLNASRDRYAILTLWGSAEEREGNEADLAAIMSSVRVAAETGSFWAGNSAAKSGPVDKARGETAPPAVAAAPAARPAAPPAQAVAPAREDGPNETRLATYLFGTVIQTTIKNCDVATTGRQREAIERKMVVLRAEMAPYTEQLKEVMKDMPGCPPPGREGKFQDSMTLFIDKSPEDFALAMEQAQSTAAPVLKAAPASPTAGATNSETKPALETRPVAETKPAQPYGVRKALFVTRAARYFGDVEARSSNVFRAGEVMFSYLEPLNQSEKPVGNGQRQAGVIVDMEVRTLSGEVLGGKSGMSDSDISLRPDQGIETFYLNTDVTLTQLRPGSYTLVYILKDKLDGRTVEVPQAFTLVSAKDETGSTAPAGRPLP